MYIEPPYSILFDQGESCLLKTFNQWFSTPACSDFVSILLLVILFVVNLISNVDFTFCVRVVFKQSEIEWPEDIDRRT